MSSPRKTAADSTKSIQAIFSDLPVTVINDPQTGTRRIVLVSATAGESLHVSIDPLGRRIFKRTPASQSSENKVPSTVPLNLTQSSLPATPVSITSTPIQPQVLTSSVSTIGIQTQATVSTISSTTPVASTNSSVVITGPGDKATKMQDALQKEITRIEKRVGESGLFANSYPTTVKMFDVSDDSNVYFGDVRITAPSKKA